MRLYYILIITAVLMAFTTGYLVLFLQGNISATYEDIVSINKLKQNFQKVIAPDEVINFNREFKNKHSYSLISPIFSLEREEVSKNDVNYSSNEDCFSRRSILFNFYENEKALIWEEFRCKRTSSLPYNFFSVPPFLHPSGKSYAFLAHKMSNNLFKSEVWLERNSKFFHVLEIREIPKLKKFLDLEQIILSTLTPFELSRILQGEGTLLNEQFLFARLNYDLQYNILEYRVYSRKNLEKFLENTGYKVSSYKPHKNCFYKDGVLCWNFETRKVFQLMNSTSLLFFICSLIIISIVVSMLVNKIKIQRKQDERKRLALQVLTHEFRTPVASLILLIEKIQDKVSILSNDLQEDVLRMSSEVFRLQRLTEKSRHYLKAQTSSKLIDQKISEISSVNDFISTIAQDYEKVDIKPLESDRSLTIDSYWLSICIKNILENSYIHGRPPVVIELTENNKMLNISIKDQGKCQFLHIDDITQEFKKGGQSKGSGLGMNIVKKVVTELGGSLTFSPSPTTFIVSVPIK